MPSHPRPLARKILAFCNTVHEAITFTNMLLDVGIAADHYNAQTLASQRQEILSNFQRREAHGGLRVLVTVDVLSEGVDLPAADTCLFVAPRRGIRLRQCVGRVLRTHPEKIDVTWLSSFVLSATELFTYLLGDGQNDINCGSYTSDFP